MQEQHSQNCVWFLERLHIYWGRGETDGGELGWWRDRGREVKKKGKTEKDKQARGEGEKGRDKKNKEEEIENKKE